MRRDAAYYAGFWGSSRFVSPARSLRDYERASRQRSEPPMLWTLVTVALIAAALLVIIRERG